MITKDSKDDFDQLPAYKQFYKENKSDNQNLSMRKFKSVKALLTAFTSLRLECIIGYFI